MVSTVLLVTGMTTLLHMFVGTRLPLVQGPSFVYLAPALAIINSPEFFGLNDNVCMHFRFSYHDTYNMANVAVMQSLLSLCPLAVLSELDACISLQNFKHIMKHLQGAIIIGGAFQVLLGYTGLMSLFLRYASFMLVKYKTIFLSIQFNANK